MKKVFVLEDDADRIKWFRNTLSKHYLIFSDREKDAIEILKASSFDYIFLDNDLGLHNGEGKNVAKFIRDNDVKGKVIIHSHNFPAGTEMKKMLPNSIYVPFVILMAKWPAEGK